MHSYHCTVTYCHGIPLKGSRTILFRVVLTYAGYGRVVSSCLRPSGFMVNVAVVTKQTAAQTSFVYTVIVTVPSSQM
jgi:hypothetical protein